MTAGAWRTTGIATLVAGTLDILSAFLWSGAVAAVLRSVASGPFGDRIARSEAGPLLGLAVHFAIMAVMVAAYVITARHIAVLRRSWLICGLLYGLALWIVMYWIVMPLRWESYGTPSDPVEIAKQLISHCLLVGLPIAWITARGDRT